uniref:Uncharacterized protein n=1 Tax=Oryza sativa subsp. japonica TaxID=39947 RepID=Q6YTX3_ORYSJ|nr:hypothetical protein [Oryza sativa Japonica Group]
MAPMRSSSATSTLPSSSNRYFFAPARLCELRRPRASRLAAVAAASRCASIVVGASSPPPPLPTSRRRHHRRLIAPASPLLSHRRAAASSAANTPTPAGSIQGMARSGEGGAGSAVSSPGWAAAVTPQPPPFAASPAPERGRHHEGAPRPPSWLARRLSGEKLPVGVARSLAHEGWLTRDAGAGVPYVGRVGVVVEHWCVSYGFAGGERRVKTQPGLGRADNDGSFPLLGRCRAVSPLKGGCRAKAQLKFSEIIPKFLT